MKAKIPKSYLSLSQKEKNIIGGVVSELVEEQVNKEEAELQKIWLQLACIVLHNAFGFGENRLNCFLGNWKRMYSINAEIGSKQNQDEYLKNEIKKIFGKNGYPYEWVEKLAKE